MPVAHTIDQPARHPNSFTLTERSGTPGTAVLLAVIAAVTLALLGCAYFAPGPGDGYPDPTQQWTD